MPWRCTAMVVALAAGCTRVQPTEAPSQSALHIAVVGDRTGEPDDVAWYEIFEDIERLGPDLVLSVGDIADDTLDPDDWSRALAATQVLSAPIAYAPGNHDIVDEASRAIFEAQTGQARYRSFDHGGVHVVIVDNALAGSWSDLSQVQRDWLVGDLAAHADELVLVVMHKPFWAQTIAAGEADPMHALFVEHGVEAVFCGHWHSHFHQVIDGVAYTNVGTSGGGYSGIHDARLGNAFEFVWVRVGDGQVHQALVESAGVHDVGLNSPKDQSSLRALWRGGLTASVAPGVAGRIVVDLPEAVEIAGPAEIQPGAWKVPVGSGIDLGAGSVSIAAEPGAEVFPAPRLRVPVRLPDAGVVPFVTVFDIPRRVSVPRGPAPTIDGVLGEGEWASSAELSRFTNGKGQVSTADPTTVFLRHDDVALYMAAVLTDRDPAKIKRLHHDRDKHVVYDDRIGLQLAPADDQLYWFYANANGSVWDLHADLTQKSVRKDWDGAQAKASMTQTGWVVEVQVAFADLGIEGPPPSTLRFDLRRKQEGSQQAEATWTPGFYYNQVDRFGYLDLVR